MGRSVPGAGTGTPEPVESDSETRTTPVKLIYIQQNMSANGGGSIPCDHSKYFCHSERLDTEGTADNQCEEAYTIVKKD
jgi:hypothetical protein